MVPISDTHAFVANPYSVSTSVDIYSDAGYGFFGLLSVEPDMQRGGFGSRFLSAVEDYFRRVLHLRESRMKAVSIRSELIGPSGYYRKRGYSETGLVVQVCRLLLLYLLCLFVCFSATCAVVYAGCGTFVRCAVYFTVINLFRAMSSCTFSLEFVRYVIPTKTLLLFLFLFMFCCCVCVLRSSWDAASLPFITQPCH